MRIIFEESWVFHLTWRTKRNWVAVLVKGSFRRIAFQIAKGIQDRCFHSRGGDPKEIYCSFLEKHSAWTIWMAVQGCSNSLETKNYLLNPHRLWEEPLLKSCSNLFLASRIESINLLLQQIHYEVRHLSILKDLWDFSWGILWISF